MGHGRPRMVDCGRSRRASESQHPHSSALGSTGKSSSICVVGHKAESLAVSQSRFRRHASCTTVGSDMLQFAVRARDERRTRMKRARHQRGSVVFDKRRKTWNYLTSENGKRRSKLIGTRQQYPTKSAAWEAAEKLCPAPAPAVNSPTVSTLVEQYRQEKQPQRLARDVLTTHGSTTVFCHAGEGVSCQTCRRVRSNYGCIL